MKNIRKNFHYYLLIVLSLSITYSSSSQVLNTKNLAVEWINFLNKHDTVSLITLYSDSVKIESPNWEGVKTGRASVNDTYSRYFTSTPDMQHEINNIIATDGAVIIEYTFRGTLKNPEHNTPEYMRGKKYTLAACAILRIQNGKIVSQKTYFDQVSFLRQVGFFDQK